MDGKTSSRLSMEGKTAIVTGSTQGPGEAISHLSVDRGVSQIVICGLPMGRRLKTDDAPLPPALA